MIKKLLLIFLLTYPQFSHSSVEVDFNIWLKKFKITAHEEGISEETINNSLKNAKYLKQVIKYDRYQPEFFEDTKTYIKKRATRSRMLKAKALLIKNKKLFCGESMFAKVSNASKYGFISMVRKLQENGVKLIDCQVHTDHLESLGAEEISRKEFLKFLQ